MFWGIKTLTLFFFGRDRRRVFGGIGGGLERVSRETRRENKSLHLLKGKNGRRRGGSRRQTPLAHQNPFKLGRLEEGEMASWEKYVNFQFPPHFKLVKLCLLFAYSFLFSFHPSKQQEWEVDSSHFFSSSLLLCISPTKRGVKTNM